MLFATPQVAAPQKKNGKATNDLNSCMLCVPLHYPLLLILSFVCYCLLPMIDMSCLVVLSWMSRLPCRADQSHLSAIEDLPEVEEEEEEEEDERYQVGINITTNIYTSQA